MNKYTDKKWKIICDKTENISILFVLWLKSVLNKN